MLMLDKKDKEILKELQKDSRQPTSKLSSKVGMKRTTVNDRINKMKQSGIIKTFTAVPNYCKIGKPVTVFLLVSFKSGETNTNGKTKVTQRELATRIARFSRVYEVHIITGEYDLLVKARGESLDEIGILVVDKIRVLKGVDKSYTLACYSTVLEKV